MARTNESGTVNIIWRIEDTTDGRHVKDYCFDHDMTMSELARLAIGKYIDHEFRCTDGRSTDYDAPGASTIAARLNTAAARLIKALNVKATRSLAGEFQDKFDEIHLLTAAKRVEAWALVNEYAVQAKPPMKCLNADVLILKTDPAKTPLPVEVINDNPDDLASDPADEDESDTDSDSNPE